MTGEIRKGIEKTIEQPQSLPSSLLKRHHKQQNPKWKMAWTKFPHLPRYDVCMFRGIMGYC